MHRLSVRLCAGMGILLGLAQASCGSDTAGTPEERARAFVKVEITSELANLVAAAEGLKAAAPMPDANGWNDTADVPAVTAMKSQWKAARVAYERVEGAIAVLFPELDVSTDERYDGFIADTPDDNLFDDMTVTGIHAIERILWAGHHPAEVVAFESALPNYKVAGFPATMAEAADFRDKLATKLVTDARAMRDMFAPLSLDTAAAFRGVIGSVAEQIEKVELAQTGEEESRYAQHTLADMRANLQGGENTYAAFRDWVKSKEGGRALDTQIMAGFTRIQLLYDSQTTGDALPPVPAGFNPVAPTAADLATPYGIIFGGVSAEASADAPDSLVSRMTDAADLIGIPQLPPE